MFQGIDPVAMAMLGFAIIGVVEFVKRVADKDYRSGIIIAGAAIAGALLAPQAGAITWFQGMLIGLQASGMVTTASYIGK